MDEHPRPAAWSDVLPSGLGVGRALAAAHAHGALHRDVEPAKILERAGGKLKLLDFAGLPARGRPKRPSSRQQPPHPPRAAVRRRPTPIGRWRQTFSPLNAPGPRVVGINLLKAPDVSAILNGPGPADDQ